MPESAALLADEVWPPKPLHNRVMGPADGCGEQPTEARPRSDLLPIEVAGPRSEPAETVVICGSARAYGGLRIRRVSVSIDQRVTREVCPDAFRPERVIFAFPIIEPAALERQPAKPAATSLTWLESRNCLYSDPNPAAGSTGKVSNRVYGRRLHIVRTRGRRERSQLR
jgi:hypothetical protein